MRRDSRGIRSPLIQRGMLGSALFWYSERQGSSRHKESKIHPCHAAYIGVERINVRPVICRSIGQGMRAYLFSQGNKITCLCLFLNMVVYLCLCSFGRIVSLFSACQKCPGDAGAWGTGMQGVPSDSRCGEVLKRRGEECERVCYSKAGIRGKKIKDGLKVGFLGMQRCLQGWIRL